MYLFSCSVPENGQEKCGCNLGGEEAGNGLNVDKKLGIAKGGDYGYPGNREKDEDNNKKSKMSRFFRSSNH